MNQTVLVRQKSRSRWALEGDENTGYFHVLINKQLRSQRINGLKICGFWVSDPKSIKQADVKCFANRFVKPIQSKPRFLSSKFKKVSSQLGAYREEPFTLLKLKPLYGVVVQIMPLVLTGSHSPF